MVWLADVKKFEDMLAVSAQHGQTPRDSMCRALCTPSRGNKTQNSEVLDEVLDAYDVYRLLKNKKLSCRREATRRYVSIKSCCHSRSFEITHLSRPCVRSHCE